MSGAASILRRGSSMRSFILPFVFFVSGVSACSFLLDTESLQKGGAAVANDGGGSSGASGAGGGAVGDASTGADSSSPTCTTDFDCQGLNFDGCRIVHCNKGDGVCGPSEKRRVGVVPEGAVDRVTEADEIGYPTLLVDNGNGMPNSPMFYLDIWARTGTTNSNIELHRYNENPLFGGASADLAGILPGAYEQFGSSPGMAVVGLLGGRLRLLFAGDSAGLVAMGMHEVDIDEGTFKAAPQAQQPKVDPGVVGYDTKPQGPVPRLISDNWGMWVQGEKLFFFDNQVACNAGLHGQAGRRVHARPRNRRSLCASRNRAHGKSGWRSHRAVGQRQRIAVRFGRRHGRSAPRRDCDVLPRGGRERPRMVARRSRRPLLSRPTSVDA